MILDIQKIMQWCEKLVRTDDINATAIINAKYDNAFKMFFFLVLME